MTTTRRTLVGAATIACALSLTACNNGNNSDATPTNDTHDHGAHDHDHDGDTARVDEYEGIRGEISRLPGESADGNMAIRHEHIPGFKSETGEIPLTPDGIPGMKSMTMPFPLAEGVSLDGYSVGDKVAFSFRVNWGGETPWELTSIEKLPEDAEISYENTKDDTDQEP